VSLHTTPITLKIKQRGKCKKLEKIGNNGMDGGEKKIEIIPFSYPQ
jgi:hypothetical protein